MDTFQAIKERRSVKHFDANYEMGEEEVHQLLSLAILSPTAFNIQQWRFVIVKDKALREKIKVAAWYQEQVTDASLLIVLCADLKAWEKEPARYWKDGPENVRQIVLPSIDAYYRGKEQVQRDEAMRSCGICAQTIMLAAKAMGYDSCPMDGFSFKNVAELIHLPDDHVISMILAVGKPTQAAWPRPGQLPLEELIIENTFE